MCDSTTVNLHLSDNKETLKVLTGSGENSQILIKESVIGQCKMTCTVLIQTTDLGL